MLNNIISFAGINIKKILQILLIFSIVFSIIIYLLVGIRFVHYCSAAIIGILLYYLARGKILDRSLDTSPEFDKFSHLFTPISIIIFIGIAVAFVILHQYSYANISIVFFLLIAFLISLVFINIFLSKDSIQINLILISNLALAFLLRSAFHIVFPEGTLSRDGIYHFLTISGEIIKTGQVPQGYTYTFYPIMHIFSSISVIFCDLNIWILSVWIGALISTLGLLLVYVIGNKFFGTRIGLLSATFYVIYPYLIQIGSLAQPMTYTSIFILVLILLLFCFFQSNKKIWFLLIMILFSSLIFSHHFSSIQFLLFLLPITILGMLNNIIQLKKFKCQLLVDQTAIGVLFSIFIIFLLFYWTYVSKTLNWGVRIFDFFVEKLIQTGGRVSSEAISTHDSQIWIALLNELGYSMLILFIIIGILIIFEKTKDEYNFFQVVTALIAINLVAYIAFSYLFPSSMELLPWRTYAFIGLLSPILASISIMALANIRHMVPILVVLLFFMTFLMTASTIAMSIESPLKFDSNQVVQIRPSESQVKVSEFLQNKYDVNNCIYYNNYRPWKTTNPSSIQDIMYIKNKVEIKDISIYNGMIILMEEEILCDVANNEITCRNFQVNKVYDSQKITIDNVMKGLLMTGNGHKGLL